MLKGGMSGMLKQAQKMQENMQKVQEELSKLQTTGESGAGLVQIVLTGKHEAVKINIDDSLLKEDKDILEDLILAAFNDAVSKIESKNNEKMQSLTSGIPLPPGFKFPF